MALINCPECGKEISDTAVSCPHCGYGINQTPVVTTQKKSNVIPIFLLICFLIAGCICFYKTNENNQEIEIQKTLHSVSSLASDLSGSIDSTIHSVSSKWKLEELQKTKRIFLVITGACAFGSCICIIIIVSNNKANKRINN